MNEQDVRAAFEKWAEPRGYSLERTTDSYKSQGTKSAWRGWKAALLSSQSQIEAARNAARYQYIKKYCYLKTTAGYDGPITQHRLEIPAAEDTQDLDVTIDREIAFNERSARALSSPAQAEQKGNVND